MDRLFCWLKTDHPVVRVLQCVALLVALFSCCYMAVSVLEKSAHEIGLLPTYTPTPSPTVRPPPTNTARPTRTPVPTHTPRPTNTPRPTATPIPEEGSNQLSDIVATGRVAVTVANVRAGPGIDFEVVDQVSQGDSLLVYARTESGWLQINTDATQWIAGDLVELSIDIDQAPVAKDEAPGPTPTPTRTPRPKTTPTGPTPTRVVAKSYQQIDPRLLEKNPRKYKGEYLRVSGEVFMIRESQTLFSGLVTTFQIWADVPGEDLSTVNIVVEFGGELPRVFEGTRVIVYGVGKGSTKGTNAFGAKITAPLIRAKRVRSY